MAGRHRALLLRRPLLRWRWRWILSAREPLRLHDLAHHGIKLFPERGGRQAARFPSPRSRGSSNGDRWNGHCRLAVSQESLFL